MVSAHNSIIAAAAVLFCNQPQRHTHAHAHMHSHNVVGMEGVWALGSHNLELFRAQDERKCVSKESANDIQSRCGGLVGKIVRRADESRRKTTQAHQ